MATSGITLWSQTRDQIINGALRKCQVLQEGQTASAAQIVDASEALNNLVAEFRTLGMPLWKRQDLSITLVAAQQDYSIGVAETIASAYPLKLLQARLLQPQASTYINLNILADYDFNRLPLNSTGIPVSVSYVPQMNKGTLSVWPIVFLLYVSKNSGSVITLNVKSIPASWYVPLTKA